MSFDSMWKEIQAAASFEQAAKDLGAQVGPAISSAAEAAGYTAQKAYMAAQQQVDAATTFVKDQAASVEPPPLDELGRKLASLGTPALLFAVAASTAAGMGLAGGAVVTTALAMLGGPLGMLGGLAALGLLTVIADSVSKYGIEAVLVSTFSAQREEGATLGEIHQQIDALPLSEELKLKLKKQFSAQ